MEPPSEQNFHPVAIMGAAVSSSVLSMGLIFATSAVHSCANVPPRTASPQQEKRRMSHMLSLCTLVPMLLRAYLPPAVQFVISYESDPQWVQFLFCVPYGLDLQVVAVVDESDWTQLALRVALCSWYSWVLSFL